MTTSVSAGSSAPLGSDQFDLIVLDFERLTQIWRNIATTKASCKDIRNLVYIKKDEIISSFDRVEIPHIPLTAFEHLIKAFANTPFLVSNEARRMRHAALCGSLVEHGTSSHPAISPRATITRSQGKSELERLEILNRWVTIKRTLEDTLDGSGRAVECLRKIIAYDLREIRHNSVTSDDATSLRALELAANTRTGVAEEDRSLIDKIISSKISSLKYSENASFSSFSSPDDIERSLLTTAMDECERVANVFDDSGYYSQAESKEPEAKSQRSEHESCTLSQEDVGLWTAKKIQELRDEKALVEDQLVVEENVCAITANCLEEAISDRQKALSDLIRSEGRHVESLAEAEEDIDRTSNTLARLSTRARHQELGLAEVREDIDRMSEALTKLSTRERHLERRLANANVEIAQMEENNQEADVILEEAREENTALVRNIEELSAANAQYVEGLAVARVGLDENIYLRQQLAAVREELERIRSSIAPAHVDALTAQNHYLEDELAEAQGKLDQMRAFLGPGPIPRTHN